MNTDPSTQLRTGPLTHIPPQMAPWGLQLVTPEPSEFGAYHLIGVEQASIETHHQVEVIDEDGKPMRGVVVVFGFDSGKDINSAIVKNCTWQRTPVARFEHTGVSLQFALRRTNVIPAADRLSALEAWVTTFDERLKALEPGNK